jgi:hypothetical protein
MKAKKRGEVFQLHCPRCYSLLWIDPVAQEVIRSEKPKRKKGTLDELLLKEKKKREGVDRKFQATAELEKERWKKIQEKYKKAFTDVEEDEES